MNIGIIDYGAGNLRSAANAIRGIGLEPSIVSDPAQLDALSHLVLPGVGAFGDCMAGIHRRGLADPIREWVKADRPFLGICIGYQVLFEGSEESPDTPGLGLLPGKVVRFGNAAGLKIPHMGWNSAQPRDPSDPAWQGLGDSPYFYFVHSYFPVPADPSIVAAETCYGQPFAAAARSGRLFAVQFHPEKSQHAGQALLRNLLGVTGSTS